MKEILFDAIAKKLIAPPYECVRDMPFKIRIGKKDYYEELKHIEQNKQGACSQKHYFLGLIYENLGLGVTYLTYPFRWSGLNVNFPKHLKILAEKMPICYHLALEINIGEKKVFLDATWDSPLEEAGFKINQINDGFVNMKNAVNPCGECVVHQNGLERSRYIESLASKKNTAALELEIKFYSALNLWLSKIRNKKVG